MNSMVMFRRFVYVYQRVRPTTSTNSNSCSDQVKLDVFLLQSRAEVNYGKHDEMWAYDYKYD